MSCWQASIRAISITTILPDLVDPQSLFIFKTLNVSKNRLQYPVGSWDKDPDYLAMKNFVDFLKVVNDPAERGS